MFNVKRHQEVSGNMQNYVSILPDVSMSTIVRTLENNTDFNLRCRSTVTRKETGSCSWRYNQRQRQNSQNSRGILQNKTNPVNLEEMCEINITKIRKALEQMKKGRAADKDIIIIGGV